VGTLWPCFGVERACPELCGAAARDARAGERDALRAATSIVRDGHAGGSVSGGNGLECDADGAIRSRGHAGARQ
jgi:hypothetical protein